MKKIIRIIRIPLIYIIRFINWLNTEEGGCGCIAILLVTPLVLYFIVIPISDKISAKEQERRAKARVEIIKADSCFELGEFKKAIEYYKKADVVYENDSAKALLIKCFQLQKNFDAAMACLDNYEEFRGRNKFTMIRRSEILLQKGDIVEARRILNEIIAKPVKLSKAGFFHKLWDAIMNKDINYSKPGYVVQYYYDYLASLIAYSHLLSVEQNDSATYNTICRKLFELAEYNPDEDPYSISRDYYQWSQKRSESAYSSLKFRK